MCCPATYIAIFRSHIHINAIFWWLAVASLPTVQVTNTHLLTWYRYKCGAVSGPGETGPRRLCQEQRKHRAQGSSQPSTQTGQKQPFLKSSENMDLIKEHKFNTRRAAHRGKRNCKHTWWGEVEKVLLDTINLFQSSWWCFTDTVFRASWLMGAQSAQESQPSEWGKQPIIMYSERSHQTSERSFLEKGRRLRADVIAVSSLLHLHTQGKETWEQRFKFTSQRAGDPGQGSVPFDVSIMGGIPKDLCHFNMVAGTQLDHEWLSGDIIH